MNTQEIKNRLQSLINSQYKTCFYTYVGVGASAIYIATFTDKKEAICCARDFQIATKAKSEIVKVFEHIDVFDNEGNLIDVVNGAFVGYKVINYFGK